MQMTAFSLICCVYLLCFCVNSFFACLNCTYVKMLHYDPTDTQYDLRSELGVSDSVYVEVNEINKPINYRNDLNIIQLNIRGLLNKQGPTK